MLDPFFPPQILLNISYHLLFVFQISHICRNYALRLKSRDDQGARIELWESVISNEHCTVKRSHNLCFQEDYLFNYYKISSPPVAHCRTKIHKGLALLHPVATFESIKLAFDLFVIAFKFNTNKIWFQIVPKAPRGLLTVSIWQLMRWSIICQAHIGRDTSLNRTVNSELIVIE